MKCDSLLIESAKIDSLQASFAPRPPYPTAQAFREDEIIKARRKALEPDVIPCLKIKEEQQKRTIDSIQNIELQEQNRLKAKNDNKKLAIGIATYAVGVTIAVWLYVKVLQAVIPHVDP